MGNDLKQKILVQNGIISEQQIEKTPSVLICSRCSLINAMDIKFCVKCSYPLTPKAYDEIKAEEDKKFNTLKQQQEQDVKSIREEMNERLNQILSMVQQNPKLAQVKPEALVKKQI